MGRQIKDQHSQTGDEKTGDDEVDSVEQWKPPDDEVIRDVRIDLRAALVLFRIVLAHCVDNDPLAALPVVHLVHIACHADQINFGTVICPRAKLHFAALLVKREKGDVYTARRLVNGRGHPLYPTIIEQLSLCQVSHGKVAVGAEEDAHREEKTKI